MKFLIDTFTDFVALPFTHTIVWLVMWPAPTLWAWAAGRKYQGVALPNVIFGWLPPFWLGAWCLAVLSPSRDGVRG